MENFDELLIRISTETAVLFLGQMFDQNVLFENMSEIANITNLSIN